MNFRATNKVASAAGNSRTLLLGPSATVAGTVTSNHITMRNQNNTKNANGLSASEQARMLMEEQNNRGIAELEGSVARMKDLAFDIEAAIQEDRKELEQTSLSFDKVTMMMKGTLGNVNKMLATGGSKHMCYLVAFIVCLFMALYWLMK
jgi:blocked-early-in-transport protein 1